MSNEICRITLHLGEERSTLSGVPANKVGAFLNRLYDDTVVIGNATLRGSPEVTGRLRQIAREQAARDKESLRLSRLEFSLRRLERHVLKMMPPNGAKNEFPS